MPPLACTILLLLGSAGVIYFACEYFVNGIEWVGRRFAVGQKATGAILAAAGTALPESVITFVAVVFGTSAAAKQIGVGAAIGGPLVLSTLAYAVVGWMLLALRKPLAGDPSTMRAFPQLARDQGWFFCVFLAALVLGLVSFPFKSLAGFGFLAVYAVYFRRVMRDDSDEAEDELEPLKLAPGVADPSARLALIQTLGALVVIILASRLFVAQMQVLGPSLGLPPQLLALLISPIATELPEILNAVIWVRQGKVSLALANISGSMMIQATVPSALGVLFTPWRLDPPLLLAGGVILVAIGGLYVLFHRGWVGRAALSAFGGLYLLFGIGMIALRH